MVERSADVRYLIELRYGRKSENVNNTSSCYLRVLYRYFLLPAWTADVESRTDLYETMKDETTGHNVYSYISVESRRPLLWSWLISTHPRTDPERSDERLLTVVNITITLWSKHPKTVSFFFLLLKCWTCNNIHTWKMETTMGSVKHPGLDFCIGRKNLKAR